MKTNILLISAVLACSSVSFSQTAPQSTNSSYDNYEPALTNLRSQSELTNQLDRDRSNAVNDSTIDYLKYMTQQSDQYQSTTPLKQDQRATAPTDKSGHKAE
jgi:LPS O-antigen subunit length determinant protein (WzzB/FepE family)